MDVSVVSLTPISLALIPVVLGLVSVVKMYLDARWSPLVSIVVGIAAAFVFPAVTVPLTILQGVLMGLMASGLYSGVKTTVGN